MWLALILASSPACLDGEVIALNLKAGDSIAKTAQWASGSLCAKYVAEGAVAQTKLPVSVSGKVSRSDARVLLGTVWSLVGVTAVSDETGVTLKARGASATEGQCDAAERDALALAVKRQNGEYVVTRAVAERMSKCVAGACRVVPAIKDGKVQGLKLFSVRAGSFLSALGFRNGDVLLTVNGRSLSSADEALATLDAARKSNVAVVKLQRAAEVLELTLRAEE